jgi:hypothetical protein
MKINKTYCKHYNYDEYFEKCPDCNSSIEEILMSTPESAEDARQQAIDWQTWAAEQSMSYGELIHWQQHFTITGQQWNLTEEFKENGIL